MSLRARRATPAGRVPSPSVDALGLGRTRDSRGIAPDGARSGSLFEEGDLTVYPFRLPRYRRPLRATLVALPAAVAAVLLIGSTAYANVALTRIGTDPFTDTQAQHRTEVEPDTFSFGATIVSAFQTGRVAGGGSSDIGFATSTNGGSTWTSGFLPGITG